MLYEYCFIVAVVPKASEEDSPCKKGDLKRLYVDIDSILVP